MLPYLKFIAPALATVAMVFVAAIENGTFDGPAFELGFVGLASATIAFLMTNGSTGLRRYLKALTPAALTLVAVVGHYLVTGDWNDHDTRVAIAGGLTALITLIVPNQSAGVQGRTV